MSPCQHRLQETLFRLAPVLVLVLLSACAAVDRAPEEEEDPPEVADLWAPDAAAEARYIELVEQAQDDYRNVDFDELRELYIRTRYYQPYAGGEQQYANAMFEALGNNREREALQMATLILQENYVSLDAHYVARQVYAQRGDERRRDRHDYILRALFDAIRNSGDGESRANAFRVISSHELNSFVSLFGLDVIDNELAADELGPFDRVRARDASGEEEYEIWFDISPQWTRGFDGF